MTRLVATLAALAACASLLTSCEPHKLTEDSPGWDCRTSGNFICGPNNEQGVAPGYYGPVAIKLVAAECNYSYDADEDSDDSDDCI